MRVRFCIHLMRFLGAFRPCLSDFCAPMPCSW